VLLKSVRDQLDSPQSSKSPGRSLDPDLLRTLTTSTVTQAEDGGARNAMGDDPVDDGRQSLSFLQQRTVVFCFVYVGNVEFRVS
jgi:hypothetical protein